MGLIASAGVHIGIFLLLFFVMAWRAPDPPLPEYGIELNFGLDDQGSGDIQPDKPVGSETEQVAETTAAPDEEKEEAAAQQAEVQAVSKAESPVVVREEKKVPAATEEKKKTETEKPAVSEPKKELPKELPATDVAKKGDPGNHGDDKAVTGDKGSPEGKLDANALYGTPGGGGGGTGMNLQMSGWAWADQPTLPELPDNESGRVVFEIECDGNGDITGITTVERTLSPRAEQLLKDEIRKNSLVRTSGGKVPDRSKGRIVFVLRTK